MPSAVTQINSEFLRAIVDERILTESAAQELEARAGQGRVPVEDLLVREKLISSEELAKKKAKFYGLPYIDLVATEINPHVLNIIPKAVADNYKIIAFDKEAGEIKVALVDPRNFQAQQAIDVLASEENLRVRYYVASPEGFKVAFQKYELLRREVAEAVQVAEKELAPASPEVGHEAPTEEIIKGAPVSRIVSVVLRHAVEGRASDIHIEPHANEARVRYRIDGVLKTSLTLPGSLYSAVVARIKVLANLKLDEMRVPQDGRITEIINGKAVDFRISTMPLQEGQEKVAIRILTAEAPPTLEELGFRKEHIEIIRENIKKPHGLFLISGPTGAGKSTTLYAVLNMLNVEGVNIVTLEDPIEYFIAGVNQSQIRPEVGFTFATGLRSILRQDPNIIMVGEIRDPETAELAIHAALTGHLILSTIHTNDAQSVVPRLIDLKVESFLLSATLNLVIAQRLARRICPDCKTTVEIPSKVINEMRLELKRIPRRYLSPDLNTDGPLIFYRGKGCSRCGNAGYRGRVAVAELLQGTSTLQKLIAIGYHSEEVAAEITAQEMITLRQDALMKALAGETTVEEVLRISAE